MLNTTSATGVEVKKIVSMNRKNCINKTLALKGYTKICSKKNASKKTVKVQKESTKVNIEKVEDTKKEIKNEVKPFKKETIKVKKQVV